MVSILEGVGNHAVMTRGKHMYVYLEIQDCFAHSLSSFLVHAPSSVNSISSIDSLLEIGLTSTVGEPPMKPSHEGYASQ